MKTFLVIIASTFMVGCASTGPKVSKTDTSNRATADSFQASTAQYLWPSALYPNGQPTINAGHVENFQQHKFLNPAQIEDATKSDAGPGGVYRDPWGNPYVITLGVGLGGVYRDPWGNPYVITPDLNNGGKTRDGL
ncbi:MAG: hypothetical protein ABIP71_10460 [Verrucomicrobiota bacterium]